MLTLILLTWTVGIPALLVLLTLGMGIRRNRLAGRTPVEPGESRVIELPSLFASRARAAAVRPRPSIDEQLAAALRLPPLGA